jgi:putative DNA methylase
MAWDFVEVSPFARAAGDIGISVETAAKAIERLPVGSHGEAVQADAMARDYSSLVVSTDPPYYDNIGYSDLSDFFYVWLRRSLRLVHGRTVGTMLTPKSDELVANPYRHGGRDGAERFFVNGFNSVFHRIRETANTSVPLTIYYAYKQQDTRDAGTSSTGWHTLLDGLIDAGWEVTATWPMRSERGGRMISVGTNALSSSIVLACRPRPTDAPSTTRRSFVAALKTELPVALRTLMQGAIAPVDLAQAAIGPGISVFSRYSRVREADGSDMSVKDALLLVNATLDEVIGEQESDFDPDTRFAVKWYRQYGWTQENSGIADQLARSSDTSIGELERGGIFEAKGGKARLLSPTQLEDAWDVSTDERVSVWEATIRLAAVMAKHGADQVASLLPLVQTRVNLDAVKELGFLLFHEAEKKRDTKDAILFNGLVSAWGDVNEQARKHAGVPRAVQQAFDFDEDGD